jgi:hypothetical protein
MREREQDMDHGTRDELLSRLAEAVESVTIAHPLMSADEVEQRYRRRYIPSQQFYFETARPTEHADIIVYNDEPRRRAWEARTL